MPFKVEEKRQDTTGSSAETQGATRGECWLF